jgi:uncharacterized membrane protein HdeD (DUF308 family)
MKHTISNVSAQYNHHPVVLVSLVHPHSVAAVVVFGWCWCCSGLANTMQLATELEYKDKYKTRVIHA